MAQWANTAFILANLDRYVKTASTGLDKGLEEAGLRGVGIVKANTPVDTGRLRNSMAHAIRGKVFGNVKPEDSIKAPSSDKVVVVGTNVIYAPSVEYRAQTGSRGFMLRSFYQWKPIAKKVLADSVKNQVNMGGF